MIDFIKGNLAAIIGLLIPTAIIAFSLYQRLNSNSSASIINKLWSLLVGEKDYYNVKINDFAKQQHDIDKFNLAYGFRFNSTHEIENFINWIQKHGFQISWFSGLGFRFNITNFKLRPMKKTYKSILYFQFAAITITSSILLWQFHKNNIPYSSKGNYQISFYIMILELIVAYYLTIVRLKALYKSRLAKVRMRKVLLKKLKP